MSQRSRQKHTHGNPVYRPTRAESFGGARRRDVDDRADQEHAPDGRGHYDATGEHGYARGLERFEQNPDRPVRSGARWDLDAGGIEFGRSNRNGGGGEPGPYAGRGPRGYQRSDERIREDVCDRLTEASDLDASEIDVTVRDGIVTLTGTVDGRIAKRRADDLAATVRGAHDVQNHLALPSPAASAERQSHR